MSNLAIVDLADAPAREAALDTSISVLVQAPAGSGKTELLTMRFLKLLAEAHEPEEVLAITFTRAATAEMRHRILKKLEQARSSNNGAVVPADGLPAVAVAKAALARSDFRGWRLIEQPQRLNIQTIDSLCLSIARRMPLAAKLGGTLNPIERAKPLYRRAARNAFDRLGGEDAELNRALRSLLLLRDSNLANCEDLIADMLATRDQWQHAFPLAGEVVWEEVRDKMEAPFRREVRRVLAEAHALLSSYPQIVSELLELANYATQSAELQIDILALAGATSLPPHTCRESWTCIANLLLKKTETAWLKDATKRHGFPGGKAASHERIQKDRRKRIIADLDKIPGLLYLLCEIRLLPAPSYTDEQWQTMRHLFTTLRQAVIELDTVFAEEGAVDFVEIGMSALKVLREELAGTEGIRHLLVDEFQDTSRRQHQLITSLLRNWSGAKGRTLFLVGDPMQSIYMFRQAEVELFDLVRKRGLDLAGGVLPLKPLKLATNFRSHAGLVDPLNAMFKVVFPHWRQETSAGVDFLPGVAHTRSGSEASYQIHPSYVPARARASNTGSESDHAKEAERRETAAIVAVVRQHLHRIENASDGEEFTIAILGRAKNHLTAVAAALRFEHIPFRAVELETLGERQEILDLQSIARALLHPMDRIAWLALLRAPWCGLELADLHRLCGTDERTITLTSVQRQIQECLPLLGDDAKRRVLRLLSVMGEAQCNRYTQGSFSAWIERTWTSLGGPACVDAVGYENALAYFSMLDRVESDGIFATGEQMDDQLNRLFAKPDPGVSERRGVQLMTIHKAKGLGFNVVIIPGLHKRGGPDEQPLVQYLERAVGTETEMLAAPIGGKGEKSSSLYSWVQRQRRRREAEERKRLLYVACTRARDELHLFGTATQTSGLKPLAGSLLATAWPSLEAAFIQHQQQQLDSKLINFPSPSLEAPATDGLVDLAAASEASTLRRLPSAWEPQASPANIIHTATNSSPQLADQVPVSRERPHAGRLRRVLGLTVHLLFEEASRLLRDGITAEEIQTSAAKLRSKAASFAANEGLIGGEADSCAANAFQALQSALDDEVGRWILGPRSQAQNESSWTGMLDGSPATLRIDRSFRAGDEPLNEIGDVLWILDYKTATHSAAGFEAFLEAERLQYQQQLERYGRMMRLVHGPTVELRLGLYYPFRKRLISWRG